MKKSFILLNVIVLITLCSCRGNEYKNRYFEQGGPGYSIEIKETLKLYSNGDFKYKIVSYSEILDQYANRYGIVGAVYAKSIDVITGKYGPLDSDAKYYTLTAKEIRCRARISGAGKDYYAAVVVSEARKRGFTKEQAIKLVYGYTIVGKTNQKFSVTVNTSSMTFVASKL